MVLLQRGGENGIICGMKTKLMVMTAAAAMAAVTFGGALDFAWMKGVTDKDPVSYKVGEKMVFTLTAEDVEGAIPEGEFFLKWQRSGDDGVRESGKQGLSVYRFKGLGEMDAEELFDTTMNPAKRRMLRVKLADAMKADQMITLLMGDEVEPRRKFIEDNALNVKNLDF